MKCYQCGKPLAPDSLWYPYSCPDGRIREVPLCRECCALLAMHSGQAPKGRSYTTITADDIAPAGRKEGD